MIFVVYISGALYPSHTYIMLYHLMLDMLFLLFLMLIHDDLSNGQNDLENKNLSSLYLLLYFLVTCDLFYIFTDNKNIQN